MDNDYSWIMKDFGEEDQDDLLRYRGLRRISWDLEGSRRVKETNTMKLFRFFQLI
uniref:Uncharacterized protein n=1 Tax=Meloidogyne incognita TaxID=6306 RepID=A0A914KNA7_MELIC